MKRILAIVLALVMVSSVVLCAGAETAPITYVCENGYTATKISLPEAGVGEADGFIGDRSQNYAWSSVGHGDYVYVGTSFGVVYTALKVIANAKGMDFAQLKLIIDCLYNGKLYTGDEGEVNTPPRSLIAKINTKTYETEIINTYDGVVGFRAATKLNDKIYFAASTANQPYILEVDPENGDATNIVCYSEKTTDPSVSTGIRGLTTYRDMLVATLITDNGAYMVASNNPSAGQEAFEVVCTQEDLLDYPAYHYMDSIFGGSIWDIVEYNDKLYMSVVTGKNGSKQPFALFSAEVDENGDELLVTIDDDDEFDDEDSDDEFDEDDDDSDDDDEFDDEEDEFDDDDEEETAKVDNSEAEEEPEEENTDGEEPEGSNA